MSKGKVLGAQGKGKLKPARRVVQDKGVKLP